MIDIKSWLPLVKKIAWSYSRNDYHLYEDLIQIGCIGLLIAQKKYNSNHASGAGFSTVAHLYIKHEISHYFRSLNSQRRKHEPPELLDEQKTYNPKCYYAKWESNYDVKAILKELSEWDRKVIELIFLEELTYAEAALVLKTNPMKVNRAVKRIIQQLQQNQQQTRY